MISSSIWYHVISALSFSSALVNTADVHLIPLTIALPNGQVLEIKIATNTNIAENSSLAGLPTIVADAVAESTIPVKFDEVTKSSEEILEVSSLPRNVLSQIPVKTDLPFVDISQQSKAAIQTQCIAQSTREVNAP